VAVPAIAMSPRVDKVFSDEAWVVRLIKRLWRPCGLWALIRPGPTGHDLQRRRSSIRFAAMCSLPPWSRGNRVRGSKPTGATPAG
jgi:hypothetical protein